MQIIGFNPLLGFCFWPCKDLESKSLENKSVPVNIALIIWMLTVMLIVLLYFFVSFNFLSWYLAFSVRKNFYPLLTSCFDCFHKKKYLVLPHRHDITLVNNEKFPIYFLEYQLVITASYDFTLILFWKSLVTVTQIKLLFKKIINIHVGVRCIVSYIILSFSFFCNSSRVSFFPVTAWLRTFLSLLPLLSL